MKYANGLISAYIPLIKRNFRLNCIYIHFPTSNSLILCPKAIKQKSKGIGDAIAELQVSQGNAHFKKKKIFFSKFQSLSHLLDV